MVVGDTKHTQQVMGQAAWQGARCGGTELNQDILGTQEVFSVLYPEDRWLCVCCMGITCSFLPPLTCLFRVCSVYVQGPTLGATAEQGKVGLGSSGSSRSMGKTQMNVCVCVRAKSLLSCPTLCAPMDCSPPGSSVHGILQAGILEWVATPSSRGSSQLRG